MSSNITDVSSEPVQVMYIRAAAARSKGDLVRISTGHTSGVWVDVALADNTDVYRVAVCNQQVASGSIYQAVVKGTTSVTVPSATYTAGDGLDILDGAVRDSTAAAEAPTGQTTINDFAVILTGGTTVTSVVATLHGFPITAQT